MMFHPLRQSLYSVDRDVVGQSEGSGHQAMISGQIHNASEDGGVLPATSGPVMTADAAAIIPALSRTAEMPVSFGEMVVSVGVCSVQPSEFPGGDMPLLAVCQAINDLVSRGARPLAMVAGVTVVSGTSAEMMDQILSSLVRSASRAGVQLLAADLNGAASISLNTTAAGWPRCRRSSGVVSISVTVFGQQGRIKPLTSRVRPGDVLICGGGLGHHGLAVRMARCLPHLQCSLRSDVAPLHDCLPMLEPFAEAISWMRPCAAGGLAGAVNHLAGAIERCIILEESSLGITPDVQEFADMLGTDPLDATNAGKLLLVVRPDAARQLITQFAGHPLCRDLRIIGQVTGDIGSQCQMHTCLGGWRKIGTPAGDALLGAD